MEKFKESVKLCNELYGAFSESQGLWKEARNNKASREEYLAARQRYFIASDAVDADLKKREREKKRKFRERILKKVKLDEEYLQDAVVIKKRSGFTHIFYGGLDKGNSIAHGHIVLDKNENIIYVRRPAIERYFDQEFQTPKSAD